jgi:glycosyltransferase involved in cell wall biosynthesis
MKKVVFLCDLKYPQLWKDGLWAALQILQNDYELSIVNLHERLENEHHKRLAEADCIIAWSAFGGSCVNFLRDSNLIQPKLLCIGGTAAPPVDGERFDVLFYETYWYEDIIRHINTKKIHAFGINTDIYNLGDSNQYSERIGRGDIRDGDERDDRTQSVLGIDRQQRAVASGDRGSEKVFDVITVGSFSLWKRQTKLLERAGVRLAIGEVQKENRAESYGIIQQLLEGGVIVADMLPPERLSSLYRNSRVAYIPAELHGGGERAVLEARACGLPVEVEPDNPKLEELVSSPIYDHHYYAKQLKKGIEYALKKT